MEKYRHQPGGGELIKQRMEQDDRISQLCDTIIHHIISFLPVRDAAKTIILSKRWRKIWNSTPILDFDQECFFKRNGGALRRDPAGTLVNFMSGAVLCREQVPIQVLQMSLEYNRSFYHILNQWIQISMKLNVQEINVNLCNRDNKYKYNYHGLFSKDSLQPYYCDSYYYPNHDYYSSDMSIGAYTDESDSGSDKSYGNNQYSSDEGPRSSQFNVLPSLFTYGALRVLQLKNCNITYRGPMDFRNLIYLVLENVHISEKMLHELLASCYLLEVLEISSIVGLKHLEFSTTKLQCMKLHCCHFLKEVFISAQDLRHFKFSLGPRTKLLSLHFPSLIKAEIGLCKNVHRDWDYRNQQNNHVNHLWKLLEDFSYVRDLTLFSARFQDMTFPKNQPRSFSMCNVRRLEMIGQINSMGLSAIFGLLEAFNNLESLCLTIIHPDQSKDFDLHFQEEQLREVDCASISCLRHLKKLKIRGFHGNDAQIMLLNFLIDNATILQKVDIKTYTPSFLSHREIKRSLLNLSRSRHLKLHYG